jgi:SAM-dependent methyltransferase
VTDATDKTPATACGDAWWQDRAGRTWAELADATDRQLAPLGQMAIACLGPKTGERVLDVGCGAGQTSLELGAAVGPTGQVLGVDISEALLARAQERATAAGASNVTFVRADAGTHPFAPPPFDGLFSRFGVMFFDDPRAAFANLHAALAPQSGRLSFVCWQAMERNPWAVAPLRAVQAALPQLPMPPPLVGGPGPFAFADPDHVSSLLAGAGFRAVDIESRTVAANLGGARTLDEATDYLMRIGPASRLLGDADKALRPTARAAIERAIAGFAGENGVWCDAAVLLVNAHA